MEFKPETYEAIRTHILTQYPNEACGVVIGGEFYPCENVAEDKRTNFKIAADELIRLEIEHGDVEVVVHSHPYDIKAAGRWDPSWPSASDMTAWMAGGIPWVIYATEGEGLSRPVVMDDANPAPLEGREFIHGVLDCYALVRDYFRLERGVTLPNYPRDMSWWEAGKDLYSENFEAAGFKEISSKEAREGDLILLKYRSPVINHAVIIVSPSEVLSHMANRLSGRTDRLRYDRLASKYIRYVGGKDET